MTNKIDQLFFSVWRNKIIKNNIIKEIRIYKAHNKCVRIRYQDLPNYKYFDYLINIRIIDQDFHKDTDTKIYGPNSLPPDVENVIFQIDHGLLIEKGCLSEKVKTLQFYISKINQVFTTGILPDSITSLCFVEGGFNQELDLSWLPKSLKDLTLPHSFQHDIRPGQLPDSLTELNIQSSYQGNIVVGSIPKSVKSLNFKFESYGNTAKLTDAKLSSSITTLSFDQSYDQEIKVGDIPKNVSTLAFGGRFGGSFAANSIPQSVTSMSFGFYFCLDVPFNTLLNLTSVDMGGYDNDLNNISFPQSITRLFFGTAGPFSQVIPHHYFANYPNLKSLMADFSFGGVIPLNSFPDSLTELDIGEYCLSLSGVLPKSLKKLVLSSGKASIKVGDLPLSMSSLSIKVTPNNLILPGALPEGLLELHLLNSEFYQDLLTDGILPKSLESIYLYHNVEYISSLDNDFVAKYIKFIPGF